ncbi:MAG: hypothetical protein PWQ71_660 [Bacteroidota bacterium]|jgi:hypothetical protein|nr:hypothetical protein [Bacteroidota bacterium]
MNCLTKHFWYFDNKIPVPLIDLIQTKKNSD